MELSNLVYIIPPYLLNTCLGSNLQKELYDKDGQFGETNVVALNSKHYYSKIDDQATSGCQFSGDMVIDKLIREKLYYKLAILGVFGDFPANFDEIDDEYLAEMYDTFKHRIMEKENIEEEAIEDVSTSTGMNITSSVSKFSMPGMADINWSDPKRLEQIPVGYHRYVNMPLKDLLSMANADASFKNKLPPSFVKLSENEFFEYPLPISWVPLVSSKFLGHLTKTFNMKIVNDTGYSEICMSSISKEEDDGDEPEAEAPPRNIYYNFVCDKAVSPSAGIFYYETEIIQETTDTTNNRPIILMNDTASCSNSSLNLSLGFVNKIIDFDFSNKSSSSSQTELDLDTIKNDLLFSQHDSGNADLAEDIEVLLTLRPGEFNGSFGLSLDDSTFYNSSKSSESIQRSSLLNMNRRLSSFNRSSISENDTSKLDIGISFKSHRTSEASKKIFKSDVIGCGINFIEKCVLLTLNGVLVKTITNEEIMSANSSNDGIFSENKGNSTFPMIGFKVSDFKEMRHGKPTSSKIVTNFGFKEFKFNIDNYVNDFRNAQERNFYVMTRQAQIEGPDAVDNVNSSSGGNPQLINDLIKGYLNHEGYLESLNAFSSDLQNLAEELNENIEVDNAEDFSKSHVTNRQIVKKYLINEQYDSVVRFLTINYPSIFENYEGTELLFNVKLQQYLHLLKKHFEETHEGESEDQEVNNFNSVFEFGISLQNEYRDDKRRTEKIVSISSLLLLRSDKQYSKTPKSIEILRSYESSKNSLIDNINKKILSCLGYNEVSNLENLFTNVEDNINTLSLKHNDDQFMMINFEKDNIDL